MIIDCHGHYTTAPAALGRYRDAIFFASGFAGLIYESIWTHYLKLFLGHAAYAQTLVLAIFGISSRRCRK